MECWVEWRLALVILSSAVLTRLLHSCTQTIARWIAALFVSEPTECSELRRDLLRLQADKNDTLEMADHVRHFNLVQSKQEMLTTLERQSAHHIKRAQYYTTLIITTLIEMSRIVVIILNRYTPLAILPPDILYPLSSIIAFPTGQTGVVGVPIWGLACKQFVTMVTNLKPRPQVKCDQ